MQHAPFNVECYKIVYEVYHYLMISDITELKNFKSDKNLPSLSSFIRNGES